MQMEAAAVGVDVGGSGTKGGLVDRGGQVGLRHEVPTDPHAGTKGIIAVVEGLLQRAREQGREVVAVGVGAAGFIDAASGSVTFSPNIVYDDPQLRDALESRTGLPLAVDNDANAAAWGERSFGAARGTDHLAFLTIGTGIGSGFIANGRLVRGFSGAAAEFGHVVIDPSGPRCGCGLRGCLEQFASGQAIERLAREAVAQDPESRIVALAGIGGAIRGRHVSEAAKHYDETACDVLRRAGRALGVGLSNVVNVFDPEVIVLGGSVIKAGEAFLGPARDELTRMTGAQRRRPMRLDVTALGDDAGIIGAAALAWEEVRP